jgi:hypothetical protein
MRRYCEATADYTRWASDGCAAAFSVAWDKCRMRGQEEIYTYCLSVSGKVAKILSK